MTKPSVFIVDDDQGSLKSLAFLIESMDLEVQTASRAKEFLDRWEPSTPGCLVIDVRMPGMSGLELQEILAQYDYCPPIIFITGHGDVPMGVRAIKAGAVDFLQKPIDDQLLLDRIHEAIDIDTRERKKRSQGTDLHERLGQLTGREREVMDDLLVGKSVKEIAARLDITAQTASKHRARILHKMKVENDVELVRALLGAVAVIDR